MTWDECLGQWQRRCFKPSTHPYVVEASPRHEVVQLFRRVQRTRRSRYQTRLGTDMARESIGEGGLIRCIVDRAPDCEGQPASRAENSAHLPQCSEPIGEELHALLTENHIEQLIFER